MSSVKRTKFVSQTVFNPQTVDNFQRLLDLYFASVLTMKAAL